MSRDHILVRLSARTIRVATVAALALAGGSVCLGQGISVRTTNSRAARPSQSSPSNSLDRQFYMMSGRHPGEWASRSPSDVSTIDGQGNWRSGWMNRRGGRGLTSPLALDGQQVRRSSGGLLSSGGLGLRRSYDGLSSSRYRASGATGTTLYTLTSESRTGGLFGAMQGTTGSYDATIRSWQATAVRYGRGFSSSDSLLVSSPGSDSIAGDGSSSGSTTGTGGGGGPIPATQPGAPSAATSPFDRGSGVPPSVSARDILDAQEREAREKADKDRQEGREAIQKRRQRYEEKAKEAFKKGEYHTAADAFAMAEMVARENPDQQARIKLLLLYTHIATEEDAQAVCDLVWLSTPDPATDQPRGLRALRDPNEILALYGGSADFVNQQARIRRLSISRYDYLALRAMMAWVSGDNEEAQRLAKESNFQFGLFLEKQKIDLTGLGSSNAVERTYRATVEWPKHFQTLLTKRTTETGDTSLSAPTSR